MANVFLVGRFFFVFITLLLSVATIPVKSDEEEDRLLAGINSFRQTSTRVPALTMNNNANCVAGEIANQLEDRPCSSNNTQSRTTSDYPNALNKCKIDVNSTGDGIVLPVCVPDRVATLVLTNYTKTRESRYLNDSKYSGIGIGTEEDWTVLVLTTDSVGGRFVSSGSFLQIRRFSCYLSSVVWMLFLTLFY